MILGEQENKTPKILACGPVGKLLLAIHCSVMMPDSFSTQKIAQVGISKYVTEAFRVKNTTGCEYTSHTTLVCTMSSHSRDQTKALECPDTGQTDQSAKSLAAERSRTSWTDDGDRPAPRTAGSPLRRGNTAEISSILWSLQFREAVNPFHNTRT